MTSGASAGPLSTNAPVSSTATLVLTDVEGSTRLWADHPDVMSAVMGRHHQILHAAVTAHGGWRPVDQGEGDAVFAAFDSAVAAVEAVVEAQRGLAVQAWPAGISIRVRVGVHTGEVVARDGNLFGSTVNRCARLRGLGAGGQVLLSAATFELVRDRLPDGIGVVDLGEHRMKDLTRAEHIHQLTITGLPSEFPALASLDRARHNLPVQTSSFLGRTREIAELVDLVRRERLVTVVGFGGMGKTRLALQVAAELADGDGDGVWFVDLSAVADPVQIPTLIASTLGIGEDREGVLSGLLAGLHGQRLLLVLDNLEQLLPDAAAVVAQLLRAAPDIRVLVTSREPLHLSGEQEYLLEPLPVPPTPRAGTAWTEAELGSLSTYDAVRLFLTRAAASRRDFALTPSNAAAVASICTRLDGMPLALELAAARTRVMSAEALLPRLDHALTVLTGGNRDLPNRHQTLRAMIAWSYDALDGVDQQLLDRLSVFPGTFTLDAAEAICGPTTTGDEDRPGVLDGVSDLVDRSLVKHRDDTGGHEDRYSLLVSIRDFAADQLDRHGGTTEQQTRHAAYYAQLVALPADFSPDELRGRVAAVTEDLHNMRLVLMPARAALLADRGVELALAVANVLDMMGQFHERHAVVEAALSRVGGEPLRRVELLVCKAAAERRLGHLEEFERATNTALEAARSTADPSLILRALCYQALICRTRAQVHSVIAEADEVISRLPETGTHLPRWLVRRFWDHNLGLHVFTDPRRAVAALSELAASDRLDPGHVATTLGSTMVDLGRWVEAERLLAPYEDPQKPPLGSALAQINAVLDAARLRLATGSFDQAAQDLDIAQERVERVDAQNYAGLITYLRAALERVTGDSRAARRRLEAFVANLPNHADRFDAAPSLWLAAVIAREDGDLSSAENLLAEAWAAVAGWDAQVLDVILECLLERAVQVSASRPTHAVWLLGLVQENRGPFALGSGVDYDSEAMLDELRIRLGPERARIILESTAGQPLPDNPVLAALLPKVETDPD